MMMSLFFLVPFVSSVMLLLGLVFALHFVGKRYARYPRVTDAACGSCRYLLSGIASDVCPECGGKLRDVGILLPFMPGTPKQPLATWIGGAWIVLIAVVTLPFVAIPVSVLFPNEVRAFTKDVDLRSPKSGAYEAVNMTATSATGAKAPNFSAVDVVINLPARNVGPRRLALTHPAEGEADSYEAFDAAELRALFALAGLDPDDRAIALEMEAVQRYAYLNYIVGPDRPQVTPGILSIPGPLLAFDSDALRAAMIRTELDPDDAAVMDDLLSHLPYAIVACAEYFVDAYIESLSWRELPQRSVAEGAQQVSVGGGADRSATEVIPFLIFRGGGGGTSTTVTKGTPFKAIVVVGMCVLGMVLIALLIMRRHHRYWHEARRRAAEEHLRRLSLE